MPKPLLRTPQTKERTETVLSATRTENKQEAKQMDKLVLDRLLRQPRSKAYMEAMHKLDAGGHTHNHHQVAEIVNALRSEFPDLELSGVLLGYVSKCYLGKPYEVHTLDLSGQIIEHYQSGQVLPNGLEKARGLAIYGGYDFVEVYVDCCRCVSSTGAVSVVR